MPSTTGTLKINLYATQENIAAALIGNDTCFLRGRFIVYPTDSDLWPLLQTRTKHTASFSTADDFRNLGYQI